PAAATRSGLGFLVRDMLADLLKRAGVPAAEVADAEREDDQFFAAFGSALATGLDHAAGAVGEALTGAGIDLSGRPQPQPRCWGRGFGIIAGCRSNVMECGSTSIPPPTASNSARA